eukprot:g16947.t1
MAQLRETFAVSVLEGSLLSALASTRAEFEQTAGALFAKLEKGLQSAQEANQKVQEAMDNYRRSSIQDPSRPTGWLSQEHKEHPDGWLQEHRGASGTIRRLRLIDFDRVSLSSLNRHAVALRRDVGLPKVASCAEHFRAISPTLQVDARDAMFTAEAAEELLLQSATGEVENPRLVVDCIDDVKTKVELLAFCSARGLPVVSALGSGAKDDPTKICVAQGLRDIDNDPLATKLRKACSTQGMDWSHISFIYSSQKVQRALLPLSDEQRSNPEEFGSVANFRLRVIPVLGPQPAAAGMAIASQVLNRLDNLEEYWPQPTPAPRRNLVDKLLDSFKRDELNASGEKDLGLLVELRLLSMSSVNATARPDSFLQLMPELPKMPRRRWYGAPRLDPARHSVPPKPRLLENRKCLLDNSAMSVTMLASEPLDTQATDALMAQMARSAVLELREKRLTMKAEALAKKNLPKMEPGGGGTVQSSTPSKMASEAMSKRQALEVLQSAQEGLSVKAVLELQRMEQVSPSMKAAVAAAICMVSGHYDTAIQVEPLGLSRAAWPELRALVVKPGQVISALRNFSFAVDGGHVPAKVVQVSKECYEAGEGSPTPEDC